MKVVARFFRNLAARVSSAGELLAFFSRGKAWWLTPLVLIILVFGVLVIFAQSSAVASFIYTLF